MQELREEFNRKTFTRLLDRLNDLDPILDVGNELFRAFERLRLRLGPVGLHSFVPFTFRNRSECN